MYRKKLMAACLTGALVVSMTATNVVPFVAEGTVVEAAAKSVSTTLTVHFVTADGKQVASDTVTYKSEEDAGNCTFKLGTDFFIPDGYHLAAGAQTSISIPAGSASALDVLVEANKAETKEVTLNIYDIENKKQVKEEKMTVAADATAVNTGKITLPEGYEFTVTGDLAIRDNNVYVEVKPVKAETKEVTLNIYDIENKKQVKEEKMTVAADATYVNTGKITLPKGYEFTETGDLAIRDGNVYVEVKPAKLETVMTVTFETEDGTVLGTKAMKKDAYAGETVSFKLGEDYQLPEGYEVASEDVVTDLSIEAGSVGGHTVVVKKSLGTAINVVFKDRQGNVIAGGDYFVDKDGDGVANFSELPVPEGYKLIKTGDFFVSDFAGHSNTVEVDRDGAAVINVVFKDRQGNVIAGGDYFVDEDGDGVANFSELPVPEGYKLVKTGDFFVTDYVGHSNTVVVDRDGAAIINVVFKSEGGKNLGGGDYFVDEDGDGVANFSELPLPEGYELIQTGDFFVSDYAGQSNVIVLHKTVEGTIINVVFEDEDGNNLGGGDYFVDKDDDGVANFSELPIPEGYELIETGDFFVADYVGQSNVIVLSKIAEDVPVDPEDPTNPENPETPSTDNDQKEETTVDTSKKDETAKKEDSKADKKDAAEENKAPKTGDSASVAKAAIPMGISLAVIADVLRRKFRR